MMSSYNVADHLHTHLNPQKHNLSPPLSIAKMTPPTTPTTPSSPATLLADLAYAHIASYEAAIKAPPGGPSPSSPGINPLSPFPEAYVADASSSIARALSSYYLPGFISYTLGTPTLSTIANVTGWIRMWFATGLGMDIRCVRRRVEVVSVVVGGEQEERELVSGKSELDVVDEMKDVVGHGTNATPATDGTSTPSSISAPSVSVTGSALCHLTLELTPFNSAEAPYTWTNVYAFRARTNPAGVREMGFEFVIADNEVLELIKRRPMILDAMKGGA